MSKAPKNIEKIILGVAVLIAGGLVALGFMKSGKVEEQFDAQPAESGGEDSSVKNAEQVPATVNSLTLDRTIESGTVPAQQLEGGERPVDLFTGVPLYADRDNPNEPVDPVTSPDVHPPIPNVWWLKYDITPKYADSPQRDADADGFTNLEEFQAGTSPSDSNMHPPLVAKLSYLRDESVEWLLEYGFDAGGKWLPKLSIDDKQGGIAKNKANMADGGYAEGDTFFGEEPMKDRFKFIGFEERKVRNERLNFDETLKFAIYEDQRPNKKGTRYEIPNRVPKAELRNHLNYDRTAVLELQALGMEGQEFKVEENTQFSLPPGGEEKTYLLKEVTPENVVVEWQEDGQTQSVEIPKGGLPSMDLSK